MTGISLESHATNWIRKFKNKISTKLKFLKHIKNWKFKNLEIKLKKKLEKLIKFADKFSFC